MKPGAQNRHVIDLIFPLSIFFVFTASALGVILLAANIYSSQTKNANDNYMMRTSLAYVNEKIRQNDADGGVLVSTIEGQSCLALQTRIEDIAYTTYIYAYDGMLKELFIRDDAEAHLKDGQDIMEVLEFSIEEIGENLFRFTSVDADGNTATLIASERSTS